MWWSIMPAKMWGHFSEQLTADSAPDPQQITDAVNLLIATPAGQRPLRTVVDPMAGGQAPETINRTSDEVQANMFEQMGMQAMLALKTK